MELEVKNSDIIRCLPSSIVQRSKLYRVLYILYVNETPELHKLLEDESTMKHPADHHTVPGEKVDHQMINFIDDSYSTLIFNEKDTDSINKYITAYIHLLSG